MYWIIGYIILLVVFLIFNYAAHIGSESDEIIERLLNESDRLEKAKRNN